VFVVVVLYIYRAYISLQRQKENATCPLTSPFRRSDQMLSDASAGLDDETLFHLQPGDREESKCGSGSTEWGPSSGEMSLPSSMFGFGADIKPTSGKSTMSAMTGHHSESNRTFPGVFRLMSETAAAVAGIPRLPSIGNNSSLGSTDLYNSAHSSIQTKLESDHRSSVGMSCHGSIPHQVEDDDEQLNWNPVEDMMRRIKCKIRFLKKSAAGSVTESDIDLLQLAEGTDPVCVGILFGSYFHVYTIVGRCWRHYL